jgi:hypothetical protein
MPTPHRYRITSRSWHRTHRRLERHIDTALGRSPWSALRAWWRMQRQWQPLVEVEGITPDHRHCPHLQLPTSWVYDYPLAP